MALLTKKNIWAILFVGLLFLMLGYTILMLLAPADLAVKLRKNEWVWQIDQSKSLEFPTPKSVVFSTLHEDILYILLENYTEQQYFDLVALQLENGELIWHLPL